VSLLGAKHLWGLTCPTAPAGVSHLTLQKIFTLYIIAFIP